MDLSALRVPVIAAPMAGGPSTPELVAAVSAAGGFGYLAAGYLTPDALREKIAATRALTDSPFGVNVFVPARLDEQRQGADVEAYRGELLAVADALGVELPQPRWDDTDHFADKIDLLVDDPVDTVSFTFGCPGAEVVRRLQSAGSDVVVTVTDADEALAAAREGADALCVQGSQAGGHRSTHRVDAIPNDLSYVDLLREVRSVSALPLVAAGGIADGREAARALSLGAVAVQAGTAFLLADEAGTSAAHRAGVQDPALDRTVVTRAFSGRPARGLRNQFVRDHDARSVPVFPVVDQLTKPIRAAAAKVEDHQLVSLWAGTRWQELRPAAAAEVVAALAPVDDRRR